MEIHDILYAEYEVVCLFVEELSWQAYNTSQGFCELKYESFDLLDNHVLVSGCVCVYMSEREREREEDKGSEAGVGSGLLGQVNRARLCKSGW